MTNYHDGPYKLLIGRYQTFHDGHRWLIEQARADGSPVLLAVRNVAVDGDHNPREPLDIVRELRREYYDAHPPVHVMLIPDIMSVEYGRDVGYDIVEHVPPPGIAEISGREIRANGGA